MIVKEDLMRRLHGVKPSEAHELQVRLSKLVSTQKSFESISTVAGVDVCYTGQRAYAGAVVLSFPGLKLIEQVSIKALADFPYMPGLFSFREAPAVLDALQNLKKQPDLILIDGHGVSHPRRFGIASHIGLLTGIPTIGCAKSRLVGLYERPPLIRGKYTPVTLDNQVIGAALCTRENVRPVFVSIGHLIDLETAVSITLQSAQYRIPEPLRMAHHLALISSRVQIDNRGQKAIQCKSSDYE